MLAVAATAWVLTLPPFGGRLEGDRLLPPVPYTVAYLRTMWDAAR
ncbi:MAG TPA: hypothetical protein VFY73_01730 [Ideonella sp.]|nr:hypothetical protein [Ideonella sp.]